MSKVENKKYRLKTSIIMFLSIFILSLIDILSKYFFTDKSYFEGFWIYIFFSKNYGSSFGIFSGVSFYNYFILFLSILAIGFSIYHLKYFKKDIWLKLTFIFAISGIIGNGYDRLVFGYVRDFIGLKYLFIFNVADVYITLAFICYIISEYYYKNK